MEHHLLPTGTFTRADALGRGITDSELRTALRRGELTTVHRGVYVRAADFVAMDTREQHCALTAAAVAASSADTIASHVSAAAIHGLDIWNIPLSRVHVTANRTNGGKTTAKRHVHATPFRPDEVVTINGVRVSSIERTVVDLARSIPFEEGVAVADSALARELTTTERLDSAARRMTRRAGCGRAHRVIRFADGLSESVGESRSRVLLDRLGYPAPKLQRPIHGLDGQFIGRVDFLWEEARIIGEFDGMAKYAMSAGISEREAVRREKLREDELHAAGYWVVRWTWGHLAEPDSIRRRLEYAFTRARSVA